MFEAHKYIFIRYTRRRNNNIRLFCDLQKSTKQKHHQAHTKMAAASTHGHVTPCLNGDKHCCNSVNTSPVDELNGCEKC